MGERVSKQAHDPALTEPSDESFYSGSFLKPRHRDRDFNLRRGLLLADMFGLWLSLALAMTVAGTRPRPLAESLWILPTLPLWAVLFRTYQLYLRPTRRFEPTHLDDLGHLFHALVVGTLGLWVAYKVLPVHQLSFDETLIFGLVALPLIASLRVALRIGNLRLQGPERVFAVAPAQDVAILRRKLSYHPEYEMELVGAVLEGNGAKDPNLPLSVRLEEVDLVIAGEEIDHLIVRLDDEYMPQAQALELMRSCHAHGIRFGCFPAAKGLLLPGIEVNHVEEMGFLTSDPPVLSRTANMMKRALDLVLSTVLLLLSLPLMALIALAIKLTSSGPVFFRQVRVGKKGRRFMLVKFRTMVENADAMTAELMERSADPNWLFIEDDPRVTWLGRILRATSLDELPELWNVMKGEMSLVGPRPLSERDNEGVRGWRRHRLDIVPGMTGYWQVLGRTNIPFDEMLEIDYAYVASWSLWRDLKLLALTVPIVLSRRGVN